MIKFKLENTSIVIPEGWHEVKLAKIHFSSFHLVRDCEERYTLTCFYLPLLKDSKVTNIDRQLIMQSLFSRADTGLLKDDSSPTMPSDVISRVIPK